MTTFDSAAWHRDAAVERGQPATHAFTHIGLFLAWLIRNDLHDPIAVPSALAAAVTSGDLAGSDLAAIVDGRLDSEVMTPDGAEFTAWYYPRYLDDYQAAFADDAEYGIEDDGDAYARIAPTIDRRYAEWIAASWGDEPSTLTFSLDEIAAMSPAELDAAARELADLFDADGDGNAGAETPDVAGDVETGGIPDRHDSLDLEALLPREIAGTPLHIISARASDWQSSLLRAAIERVGADPAEAFVALGLGGAGDDAFAVTLYAIPGVAQDALEAEFSRDAYLATGHHWDRRDVVGRRVWWSEDADFDTAFYAMGGLVVTIGGPAATVRAALDVLP